MRQTAQEVPGECTANCHQRPFRELVGEEGHGLLCNSSSKEEGPCTAGCETW